VNPPGVNQQQVEAWNGGESVHYVDHADRYDRQLAPFTTRCSNGSASRNTSRCLRRGHQPGQPAEVGERGVPRHLAAEDHEDRLRPQS